MFVWFLPFWLRYLSSWFIYGFLGLTFLAPVSGSKMLAGVLLKLGSYGLFRVFLVLFKFGFRSGVVWVVLSLVMLTACQQAVSMVGITYAITVCTVLDS